MVLAVHIGANGDLARPFWIKKVWIHDFRAISLFLAVQWSKSQVKLITSPFGMLFLVFLFIIRWMRAQQYMHVFEKKRIMSFIGPYLYVSSGQIWKWMSSSNYTSWLTHKTCAIIKHSCNIFIRRHYLTWTWHLLLSIWTTLPCYLLYPLRSILAKFGIATVISPVSVTDKAKWKTDKWPDLDLT